MLTGIHLLVTYACNFECDHCFLYSRPGAGGTFTLDRIRQVLDEAVRLGTIERVFFEGGEPMLYYPLVLAGIEEAARRGLAAGIVTNAYWATSAEDAALWLRPLAERGVRAISISDDRLHYGDADGAHVQRLAEAAARLGVEVKNLTTAPPGAGPDPDRPGRQRVTGGVMFRGRAVEKLTAGLPTRPWDELVTCPHEPLADPGRVHVDGFGNVHLCQGLLMGNCFRVPLSGLVAAYDPQAHPIVGPLVRGGPAELARALGVDHEAAYVDECHLCYALRRAAVERFGEYLGPRQVYGME
ncbi:MAG: radical SAM protein [Planctomycetes bacterium]|nr:radical SAM protein [Planctomycetota bacterium]